MRLDARTASRGVVTPSNENPLGGVARDLQQEIVRVQHFGQHPAPIIGTAAKEGRQRRVHAVGVPDTLSLSGILCVRHSMIRRSMYAE